MTLKRNNFKIKNALTDGQVTENGVIWRGHIVKDYVLIKDRDIVHYRSRGALTVYTYIDNKCVSCESDIRDRKIGEGIQVDKSPIFGRPRNPLCGQFDGIDDVVAYEIVQTPYEEFELISFKIKGKNIEGKNLSRLPVFIMPDTNLSYRVFPWTDEI